MRLEDLFEPYEGINIMPHPDGGFVVYAPYAEHEPIVTETEEQARRIEAAIEAAYKAGAQAGMSEF